MKKILFTLMAVLMAAVSNAQTVVTPPSEGDAWHLASGAFFAYTDEGWMNHTAYLPQTMQVAIDGNDIYIQGLAAAYMPKSWVKGTISGSTVTFPSGQFLGTDEDGNEYLNGQDVNATSPNEPAIDIVFAYDAAAGKLSLDPKVCILESSKANSIAATYAYWEGLVLTKDEPTKPKEVLLPEGVTPIDCAFTGHDDYWNADLTRPAQIAFNADSVYVNAISEELPKAWIKGIMKDGIVTFAANQYLGSYMSMTDYSAYNLFFSPSADVTMQYDAASGTLKCAKYITADEIGIYDEVSNAVWTQVADKAATPATPAIEEMEEISKYGTTSIYVTVPIVDTEGNPIAGSKLTYSFIVEDAQGIQTPLTFTAELYPNGLEADMIEVPCTFADATGYFQTIGEKHLIYLMQGNETIRTWKRLGVKSTYTAGGETRSSAIGWFDVQKYLTGISTPQTSLKSQADFFNLQGQKIKSVKKGLYIKNGRKIVVK